MSTSQFDPKESGPTQSDYIDMLVRILLAGNPLKQPIGSPHNHYILREQRCRLFETHNVEGKKMFKYPLLEHYSISLPLDEDYDDQMNCWIHFDLYIFTKENGRQLWGRISNNKIGFQRNFSQEERQGILKLKLEYA